MGLKDGARRMGERKLDRRYGTGSKFSRPGWKVIESWKVWGMGDSRWWKVVEKWMVWVMGDCRCTIDRNSHDWGDG